MAVVDRIGRIDDGEEGLLSLSRVARAFRRGECRVREAAGTDDYLVFADVTDRGLMVGYTGDLMPLSYPILGYRRDTKTFSKAADYELRFSRRVGRVPELGMYPSRNDSDVKYEFATYKFGETWSVSWEAWLKDGRDLGELRRGVETWGGSARYTTEYEFVAAWAGDTSVMFTAGRGNYLGNYPLTAANLQTGIETIRNMPDPSGNVTTYSGPLYLVVPPALTATARGLVGSPVVIYGGSGSLPTVPAMNVLEGAAQVVEVPFLPEIDTVQGDTAWYLFCHPQLRPAVRYGFVQGLERPEVWIRDSNARALMGGSDDPFSGSFENDSITMKLRFTFGADQADYRGAFMSKGAA